MSEVLKLWESDIQSHTAGGNIAELLKTASDHVTKSPFALTMDWRKIRRAPGKIKFNEYLDFQVYDRERFASETERHPFLSDDLHWRLCYECSDRKWDAATEDKWISEVLLNQSGIAATDTLGVLGGPDRSYGKTPIIATAAQLAGIIKDMGKPVSLGPTVRVSAPIHVTWLKRALRNLISNALRYAGTAGVSLLREDANIVLRVDDGGPGIPAANIAAMLEPFTRGEASRNRDTGGAGLGLTLARAIAEQHGGTLTLINRESGGLRAEISLPLAN